MNLGFYSRVLGIKYAIFKSSLKTYFSFIWLLNKKNKVSLFQYQLPLQSKTIDCDPTGEDAGLGL